MKKLSLFLLTSLAFIVFSFFISAQPATAAYNRCDWSSGSASGDDFKFCAGGFSSETEGKDHKIVVRCSDNCGGLLNEIGSGQEISMDSLTFNQSTDGSYYACAGLTGIADGIIDGVRECVAETGSASGCNPHISARVKEDSIFGADWCNPIRTAVPDSIMSPIIDEALNTSTVPNPTTNPLQPVGGVTDETLEALNPLAISGSTKQADLSTPRGIISQVLNFAFPLAGLILFVMLVLGGFTMVSGATNSKSKEEAKNRITAAIVGFLLLFSSFWIIRVVEMIFGLKVLD